MLSHWRPFLIVVLGLGLAGAAAAKDTVWVRVRSPHFEIVTDGGAGKAREVAAQLERMRSVFQQAIPGVKDPSQPIEVLALKNKKDFVAIAPADLFGKNKPDYAATWFEGPERNLVLLRLDAVADEHDPYPFGIIYRGYTAILAGQSSVRFPDWLTNGLGGFYETAEINDKDAELGKPNPGDLELLRSNPLLPLGVLFSADTSEQHWNQEKTLSIFSAESWALVHYLTINDEQKHTHALADYMALLGQHLDAETAAERAFGDLKQLQDTLTRYTARQVYNYMALKVSTATDPKTYAEEPVFPAQAEALRAEFMVDDQRYTEARQLLDAALQRDPGDVPAMEGMGLLEMRQNNRDAARHWYQRAVQLDASSYLTQYYFATLSMNAAPEGGKAVDPAVETSLRDAIRINPAFAPSYDALASLLSSQRQHLDEARTLELQAIALSPSNHAYRRSYAALLMDLDQLPDAIRAGNQALSFATTPAQRADDDAFIRQATQYQTERAQMDAANQKVQALNQQIAAHNAEIASRQATAPSGETATTADPDTITYRTDPNPQPVPTGTTKSVSGPIQSVFCSGSNGIDIALNVGAKTIVLHSDDYFKVKFSAANFVPKGVLQPCTGLDGLSARIDYVPGTESGILGTIVSVQLTKPRR